jgi:hypothetical protein
LSACGGGGGGGGGNPTPANRAPVLGAIGPRSMAEGAMLTIDLAATDADGDAITYDSGTYPPFATFAALTAGRAELRLAPGFDNAGTYSLTVRVRDTAGNTDEETFTLTVTDVPGATNRAPVLGPIGNQTIAAGSVQTVALTATDPDGHGMTLSATGLPAFATLTDNGGGSGSLRVAPGFGDSGSYPITVRVSDSGSPSLMDTETLTLTVTTTNRPPVIAAIADQQVSHGATLDIAISATDADGHVISLSKTGPAFATVIDNGGGSGILRLAPGSTDIGVHTVTVRAVDNGTPSATGTEPLTVTVVENTNNQVALENRLPGTSTWRLDNPAESRQIEGFSSATSVNRGETIALFVNTAAPDYELEVFRMGWYQGLGARRVFGPVTVAGTQQPAPPAPNGTTGVVDVDWSNPYLLDTEFSTGAPWRTGVYLAKLTESDGGNQSYVIFVVRDDDHAPEVLFGLPVTTYQSYNAWGGKSLYPTQSGGQQPWGSTPGTRAVKVSFNRPYAASIAPSGWYGVGAGEFLTNMQPLTPNPSNYPISAAGWDYNMVRWLEYEQYDVGYVTNVDYHRTNAHFNGVELFLSPGHDEYWTWQMFDNVEAARDAGIDLAFFSANTAYRQIRFESSNNSVAPGASPEQSQRIMVHYREVPDPIMSDGNPGNDYLTTTEFRNAPVNRPEQNLLGVQYVLAPVDGDIVISNAAHSVFTRTGLSNGSRLSGLLGYEVDMRFGGWGNVVELASSPYTILSPPFTAGTSNMTIYTAGSGAQVFATGSIQWSWGLDDFNGPSQGGLRSARLSAPAQQITANVLGRFGATPYVPYPVRAQCVRLTAVSNANGNPSLASAAEIDLLGADGRELAKTGWTISADSEETSAANNAASNAIDNNVNTIWHSAYTGTPAPLPHTLTINLGSAADVSALRYLPRQDGSLNGTIGSYDVHVADNCASPTWTRVAQSTWNETPTANAGRKIARFVR